jgi:hypothetical protein
MSSDATSIKAQVELLLTNVATATATLQSKKDALAAAKSQQ